MNFMRLPLLLNFQRSRDRRLLALLVAILGTAIVGYGVAHLPSRGVVAEAEAPVSMPRAGLEELASAPGAAALATDSELVPEQSAERPSEAKKNDADPQAEERKRVMQSARELIRAKRFEDAIRNLHEARALVKVEPRSYLLMASALEGRKDFDTARDFYAAAIDRDPMMADAYWGFASTSEALGDLEAALGAMRSFLHVQPNADPQKLKIVQARSAIWEWESKLGRGPWGPTKGIPPGFSEGELRRDGRGVGIKIPIPGTEMPDGSRKYEVKAQDKFKIFKK